MSEEEAVNNSRIQKLEEELTFLDDYIVKQDQVIMDLQKKQDKIVKELKELRQQFESEVLSASSANEKPPHY